MRPSVKSMETMVQQRLGIVGSESQRSDGYLAHNSTTGRRGECGALLWMRRWAVAL
jgi:hypothetical protein